MSTQSRVWFITGSSQGLGRALVEKVLQSGERVVATLRRREQLVDFASKYSSTQLLVVELDVVKPDHIERAFEQTKEHFGRLDIVVNNAGYGLFAEIEVALKEKARKQVEVLFWGLVHVIKRAIPFMRDINPSGQGGHIPTSPPAVGIKLIPEPHSTTQANLLWRD